MSESVDKLVLFRLSVYETDDQDDEPWDSGDPIVVLDTEPEYE